jgi:sugar phosphate isomerase/epimerase
MLKGLSPGAVGVHLSSLEERVSAARDFGFESVEIDPYEIARRMKSDGADAIRRTFDEIVPAGWGLTVEWRQDDETFQKGLAELDELAKAACSIGCTRCSTWVLSGSDVRNTDENVRFHVERFKPIADTLAKYGGRLGLEFIGPTTLRNSFKYPFIYEMDGMLDLAGQIGPNVGLLLDAWHWYTSGGTVEDLDRLNESDVVYVHVNDAPKDVLLEEHIDNVRCLPGETGVIPIAPFLQALATIDYQGSIVAEPFKRELADLPSDADRLRVVSESLDKILREAGVSSGP